MPTKFLSANANLSVAVWWTTSGGSTTTTAPGVGDDADLNGRILTVDQNFTCDNIVGSGTLAVSGSRTITANLGNSSSSWACTLSGSQTVTTIGNMFGGSAGTRWTISSNNTTWNHTGNITGAPTLNVGTVVQANGNATVIGNIVGGSGANGTAYSISAGVGTLAITGDITGGSGANAHGLFLTNATVSVTGNIIDAGSSAIRKGSGTLTYTPTAAQTATIGGKVMYPNSGTPGVNRGILIR